MFVCVYVCICVHVFTQRAWSYLKSTYNMCYCVLNEAILGLCGALILLSTSHASKIKDNVYVCVCACVCMLMCMCALYFVM